MFLTVVFLHLSKKNFGAVLAYVIQSLAIVLILLDSFINTGDLPLLFIVFLILLVKVILAPTFLIRLIKKYNLAFSVDTYLNTPITLIIIAILTSVAHSQKLTPLTGIVPTNQALLSLAVSSILLSLFLIINSRRALSQIIGVLSLENSIVAFIVCAGLEQSAGLQIGVIFNIFVWTIIATVFVSIIHKHFGSLYITAMKNLKD